MTDEETKERFLRYVGVADEEGCLPWLGPKAQRGYGRFRFEGKSCSASRVAYSLFVGPIPDGLEVDHLCRNPSCVNPGHLEAVTHRENMLRGDTIAARSAAATSCPHGHSYSGDNLMWYRGQRRCRECSRVWARERYWRLKGGRAKSLTPRKPC